MCRLHGEKRVFQEGHESYYQIYYSQGAVILYYKNLFARKLIEVKQELEMKNMCVRGESPSATELFVALRPGESKLVVIDVVKRDLEFSFEYSVQCAISDI